MMVQEPLQQFSVLGIPVHTSDRYVDWLIARSQSQQGTHVITLNAEMAIQAEQNPDLRQLLEQAELVVPDGAGVVLNLRLQGQKIQRCPGIELAESLLHRLPEIGSVYFYGGQPEVIEGAVRHWQTEVPNFAIAGYQHGYLQPADQPAFTEQLKTLQPNLILVGLGVPRQEFWIAEHRHLCPNAVWIGVGGSFDIWSGTKDRAPAWLRENHLEWTYRLYQEPWRWRRMTALPKFAWRSLVYPFRSR